MAQILDTKHWLVSYHHSDGRQGTVEVTTYICKSGAFDYGNGKSGLLICDDFQQGYDLRYCLEDDLHMAMIRDYFGKGLVSSQEERILA